MSEPLPLLSVARLVALLRETVEDNFVQVLVEGEISNYARPASGHAYFTLKDDKAQLRAVMFRPYNRLLRFVPENGMQVICGGRISLYEPRGELQMVVETMEPKGLGGLQVAFAQLKERLEGEGLFAPQRKRPLPGFPRCIGVVTSASGAAIHDILNVLRRRLTGVRIILRPAQVQGRGAAADIADGIAELNQQGEADVLIVGRGGGSLEDLWAFNEEVVARAIYASRIPVISAVGHETDVTIADMVADLRAPTPSAAAEMVAKSRLELEGHLDHLGMRLASQMRSRLNLLEARVDGLAQRLRSPVEDLQQRRRRIDELEQRLQKQMVREVTARHEKLGALTGRLDALSPLGVLKRGYAIVMHAESGAAVRRAEDVAPGDSLHIRLKKGHLQARVTDVER